MTATAERPNLLLITIDQQRYDALSLNHPPPPAATLTHGANQPPRVFWPSA